MWTTLYNWNKIVELCKVVVIEIAKCNQKRDGPGGFEEKSQSNILV